VSKDAEPIAVRVSRKVYQNVDLIGPNTIHQLIIKPLHDASPAVSYLPEGVRDLILDWRT
jgi:hypothetical protein